MLWHVTESSTTFLQDFQKSLIPQELAGKVKYVIKGAASGLEVGNIIGTVALTNGDTLHIKPKVGEVNFFRMLLVCEGLSSELALDFEEFVGYKLSDESTASLLVSRRFIYELHHILKASLRFERRKLAQERKFAEGKIMPVQTMRNIKRRSSFPVATLISIREFDTPEHRVLAEAAKRALNFIKSSEVTPHVESAQYWIKRFSGSRYLAQDLAEVNRNLRKTRYVGARGYYVKTLALAKIILGESGFTQGNSVEIYGDAVLINSATLFEEYIRGVIEQRYHPQGFSVRKGGHPSEFLYVDGTYKLIPDITIFKDSTQVLLGDAKYKSPDAQDHYQLLSYMRSYGLSTGVIFAPNFSESKPVILEKKTLRGERVVEMHLPLLDLDATEEFLGKIQEYAHFGG